MVYRKHNTITVTTAAPPHLLECVKESGGVFHGKHTSIPCSINVVVKRIKSRPCRNVDDMQNMKAIPYNEQADKWFSPCLPS